MGRQRWQQGVAYLCKAASVLIVDAVCHDVVCCLLHLVIYQQKLHACLDLVEGLHWCHMALFTTCPGQHSTGNCLWHVNRVL